MSHEMSNNHAAHGTIGSAAKSYLVGFVLSVILTAIPFWAVETGALAKSVTVPLIFIMAIVQVVVHLKYFLHLDFSAKSKESTFAFLFTALIIVMVVGLSIWIIYSSNAMMMY